MAALVTAVVVDDHPFFRDGVARGLTLSGRIQVVGEAEDGRQALEVIARENPEVALVDYQMPDMDGIAVVHAITRDTLPTRVLLLSALTDSAIVFRALEEGAAGYLAKDSSRAEAARQDLEDARETADPKAFNRVDHALLETTQLLRSLMTQLHPAVLDQAGFLPALRDLARSSSERGHFEYTIEADQWNEGLRTSADALLLAAARELLTNMVKHAGAHTVRIELSRRDGVARLRVIDDGSGIRVGDIERTLAEGHIGLTSRRVRLEAAGGSLRIRASTPSGTVAEVDIPAAIRQE